jgi:hypothetical protein
MTQLPVMTDAWPGPGDSEGPVEIDAEEGVLHPLLSGPHPGLAGG